jgi:hypothetical protein
MKNRNEDPSNDSEVAEILDSHQAISLWQIAQIDSLLTLAERVCKHVGINEIEGLSIRDWFQKEKIEQLERILIHFENQDPGVAASLQNILDRHRAKDQPGSEPDL